MNLPEISILEFANSTKMTLKGLKIRSFNAFHKCQYKCVKNIKAKETEQCFKKCEQDLDKYYEFKKSQKIPNTRNVFYNLPIEKMDEVYVKKNPNSNLTQEEKFAYHHLCLDTEVKLKNYVKSLQEYLDKLEANYLEKK